MFRKSVVLAVSAVALVAGCGESQQQREAREMKEAKEALKQSIHKDIDEVRNVIKQEEMRQEKLKDAKK